jgi:hypothetical protein
MKLFQEKMKLRIVAVARDVRQMGSEIRVNTRQREQPSMRAASSCLAARSLCLGR